MITELRKTEFYRIRHIADACSNIEVKAIVGGMNPGRVFADHPENIRAALIWIQGQGGFHIVGDPQSKSLVSGLASYMQSEIEPWLKKLNTGYVEISCETAGWVEAIEVIFGKHKLSNCHQHVFRLGEAMKMDGIPGGNVTVHRMDKNIFTDKRLSNLAFVEEKLSRFWDSPDDFFQHGFGYYARYDHTVVSLCFSAFVAGQTHAIDIETIEGYRKRNSAAAVARAFMEECGSRGVQPYWDCSPDNPGSIRLAGMVGMVPHFDYRIFWYSL
ncbi:GNAT family N-acetyltransferase [Paenibacillus sp. BAC0078]